MILSEQHYPAIRAAIDTTLDDSVLPDAVIASPQYQAKAEREIIARDPMAETRTGDEQHRIILAAIYWTAALLCPAVPDITRQQQADWQYQRSAFDYRARADELLAMAAEELAEVLGEAESNTADRVPLHFDVVSGRRGW